MKMITTIRIITLGIAATMCQLIAQVTPIKIDKRINYQRIDGFGAFFHSRGGPTYNPNFQIISGVPNDAVYTYIASVAGFTGMHMDTKPASEQVNDNNDPNVLDLTKFNWEGDGQPTDTAAAGCISPDCALWKVPGFSKKRRFAVPSGTNAKCNGVNGNAKATWDQMKGLREKILAVYGDTAKFILRTWSAPAWMKYNNCESGTATDNVLIMNDILTPRDDASQSWTFPSDPNVPNSDARPTDRKEEFAEWAAAQCLAAYNYMGFWPDYMTLSNEPAFKQPYLSIGASPRQLSKMIYAVGNRFKKEGVKTKLAWSEDIGDPIRWKRYANEVIDVDTIRPYGSLVTVHAYNADGTRAGSSSAKQWEEMYVIANKKGNRPFYQTETSCYGYGWPGGLSYAKAMFVGLKYGKVNAWEWWSWSSDKGDVKSDQVGYNDITKGWFPEEDCYALITWNSTIHNTHGGPLESHRMHATKHYSRFARPGSISVGCDAVRMVGSQEVIDTLNPILALAFQDNKKNALAVVLINSDEVNDLDITFNPASGTESTMPTSYDVYKTDTDEKFVKIGTWNGQGNYTLTKGAIYTFYGQNSTPVNVPVTSVEIFTDNYASPKLSVPGSRKFYSTVYPLTASNKGVSWSVRATDKGQVCNDCATITGDGVLSVYRQPINVTVIGTSLADPSKSSKIVFSIGSGSPNDVKVQVLSSSMVVADLDGFEVSGELTFNSCAANPGETSTYNVFLSTYPDKEIATIYDVDWRVTPDSVMAIEESELATEVKLIPLQNGSCTLTGYIYSTDTLTISKEFTTKDVSPINCAQAGKVFKTLTGVAMDEKDYSMVISPNPASEYTVVKVNSSNSQVLPVSVVDVNGKEVYASKFRVTAGITYNTISVGDFSEGVYVVKVGDRKHRLLVVK